MADNSSVYEAISLVSDPFELFKDWHTKAKSHSDIKTADAFCFATSTSDGHSSCRMLIMRLFSNEGLSFFTSRLSQKAVELRENPLASCCFYWEPFQQQIRIQGRVELTEELSDKCWET
ncbi:Pyridoxine-5'-phosphate oxidase [Oopsacas minuta]|uniref:pyridoxal 5'-phosphate synthase n=1 Tax=Oopsacas minuta TaxID=111878 RepID=A0AAV7KJI1_9METZ|nr:Pyridoxine-5'-phosphate oxidase [Oopsacas minuta]